MTQASVHPVNIQDWFPLGWTGWISLLSKGLSRVFSNTTVQKHQFFGSQPSLWFSSTSIPDYWKNHSFDYMDLCWQSNVSTNSRKLNTEKFNPVFNVKCGGTVLSSCKFGLKNHRQNWCYKEIKIWFAIHHDFCVTRKVVWRRQWHPTLVLLPGKSHGRRSPKAAVHGVAEGQTQLSNFTFTHWRRQWQPTPVFLPGESQGWGSLVGCGLWGHTESDTTEVT